jgi:uncharacterized protein YlzI (FlbEa/FlbD family)
MKPVRSICQIPPSFVVVTEADGEKRWLNTKNILSMRTQDDWTMIELDNGDVIRVKDAAADIANFLERPMVTVIIEDDDE